MTVASELTLFVLTVKLALVAPAGIVMLVGTVARPVLPLESDTTAPPEGAAALSVTVAVEVFPPRTLVGLSVSEANAPPVPPPNGFTVSVAVFVTPAPVTEIVTTVGALTAVVEMKKPPAVEPCGIWTEDGTLAAFGLLLVSTNWVVVVAGAAIRTVPLEPLVPVTEVGSSVSESGAICGVSVTCACFDTTPRVAVIVTSVLYQIRHNHQNQHRSNPGSMGLSAMANYGY